MDHGNLVAQSITHEKEKEEILEQTEAASEETIKTGLVSTVKDITAALTTGQDKISYAVPVGQHEVSSSMDAGHDKMSVVIVLRQDKVDPAWGNNSRSLPGLSKREGTDHGEPGLHSEWIMVRCRVTIPIPWMNYGTI